MNALLTAAIWGGSAALLVTMAMALARAVLGPTVYDRIVAINAFGTKTVLFIALAGFAFGRPLFLDVALVYALINFIGTVAVLKLMHYGELGWVDDTRDRDDL